MHRGHQGDPDSPGWIEIIDVRLTDGTPLELTRSRMARSPTPSCLCPSRPASQWRSHWTFGAQLGRVFARTGYTGDFFMVGQWFPKLGVWENGDWNAYPFHANAEFYADFGTYDVTITLPAEHITGGTGLPVSRVINDDDTQTIHYHAEDVIDFAWAASPSFREATRQVEGVEILYLYLPEHDWSVERALDAAEAAVSHYSRWYGPYPYARLSIVDVPDDRQGAGGMEYPTLVTAGTMSLLGLGQGLVRSGEQSASL